jgi:hypothetical protein
MPMPILTRAFQFISECVSSTSQKSRFEPSHGRRIILTDKKMRGLGSRVELSLALEILEARLRKRGEPFQATVHWNCAAHCFDFRSGSRRQLRVYSLRLRVVSCCGVFIVEVNDHRNWFHFHRDKYFGYFVIHQFQLSSVPRLVGRLQFVSQPATLV